MAAPIQHFQLKMNNTQGSKAFYENVFQWTMNESTTSPGNWEIKDSNNNSIGEMIQAPSRAEAAVVPFFNVTDVAKTKERATDKDGEVIADPASIYKPNSCVIVDIENCLFGLFS